MKIGVQPVGKIDPAVLRRIQENLNITFPNTETTVIAEPLPFPEHALNKRRQQYQSDIILAEVKSVSRKKKTLDNVLGVVDVDIFVSGLNFVFGEAECPGNAALISLWRLKPEFYGKTSNMELFLERVTKEAVHELGHTVGLTHCTDPFCVMYFSNSVFETDRKQSLFCNRCNMKIDAPTEKTRQG